MIIVKMISLGGWTGVISDLGLELQRIVFDYNSNNDDTFRWLDRFDIRSRFRATKNCSRL